MEVKNKREDLFTKDLPPIIGEGGKPTITELWHGTLPVNGTAIEGLVVTENFDFVALCRATAYSAFPMEIIYTALIKKTYPFNFSVQTGYNFETHEVTRSYLYMLENNYGVAIYNNEETEITDLYFYGIKL